MQFTRLGHSGLKVSRLWLGCMTYGEPTPNWPWALDEATGRPFIRRALDVGINTFDTANVYSLGKGEEVVGRALKDFVRREDVVIATKVHGPMGDSPLMRGLSRKHILSQVDASLKRLGTDYIDLYQIHRFDDEVPVEEVMEALHDVVRAGKVRYLGASSMYAWQFSKLQYTATLNGWTRFVSMQPQYNLIYREEEREMLPLCRAMGVGVVPWSPLARGRLAGARGAPPRETERSKTDAFAKRLYTHPSDDDVVKSLCEIAEKRGLPNSQVALAWALSRPGVTAPIIGASKLPQLEDAVAALDVVLSSEEIAALEAPYQPHAVAGLR